MTPAQEDKLDALLTITGQLNTQVSNLHLQLSGRGGVLDRLDDHSSRFAAIEAHHAEDNRRRDALRDKDLEEIESQKRLVARGLGFIAGIAFIASLAGDLVKAALARLFGH